MHDLLKLVIQREYWSNVLSRIVAVVKFLAERGLPFRGHDEIIGSSTNGNYLGVLEIISQFDPFLAQHIAFCQNLTTAGSCCFR